MHLELIDILYDLSKTNRDMHNLLTTLFLLTAIVMKLGRQNKICFLIISNCIIGHESDLHSDIIKDDKITQLK